MEQQLIPRQQEVGGFRQNERFVSVEGNKSVAKSDFSIFPELYKHKLN